MCNIALLSVWRLLIAKLDIRPQGNWAVSLMIADGHFYLP